MGIEYEIRFKHKSADDVERLLRSCVFFAGFDPAFSCYELRSRENLASMPDAVAMIESYGLYFCDNGGHGNMVLGQIVEKLSRSFGVPKIDEL